MPIVAGQDILASDFVATSAGSGDSGKSVKLNASGKLDPSFLTKFPTQDIDIINGAVQPQCFVSCMDSTGTVLYIAYTTSSASTTAVIKRYVRDALTDFFYETHSTTLAINATSLMGICCAGSYVYVSCNVAATGAVRRYAAADLSGVTTMTISGTNDFGIGGGFFTDQTNLYTYSAVDKFRIYTISGTTITAGSQITYTSSGTQPRAVCANATYVWISDTNTPSGSVSIRKYAIAGGSVISTTTPTLFHNARYNGTLAAPSWALFLPSTLLLGIVFAFNWVSDTAVTGISMHMQAITLP